jgi:hypothetical protein
MKDKLISKQDSLIAKYGAEWVYEALESGETGFHDPFRVMGGYFTRKVYEKGYAKLMKDSE